MSSSYLYSSHFGINNESASSFLDDDAEEEEEEGAGQSTRRIVRIYFNSSFVTFISLAFLSSHLAPLESYFSSLQGIAVITFSDMRSTLKIVVSSYVFNREVVTFRSMTKQSFFFSSKTFPSTTSKPLFRSTKRVAILIFCFL